MPVPQGSGVINRKSARQAVYEEVCDWIITGVLEPGEKILDSELGEYFHVSRTPVREALQQLQSQKLVLVMPGRATVVAPLDPMDIEQCYKPLAELQALAAELACGKLTQEDFFELECALRDAKAAGEKDDAAAVMACDERFHEMIVQAAGNAYVTEFSGTLMLHIRRIKYHYFHLPAMRQASASQHADILAALRAHDAALAKQRMREHWLRAMRGCLNETIAYLEQNEAEQSMAPAGWREPLFSAQTGKRSAAAQKDRKGKEHGTCILTNR